MVFSKQMFVPAGGHKKVIIKHSFYSIWGVLRRINYIQMFQVIEKVAVFTTGLVADFQNGCFTFKKVCFSSVYCS